MYYDECPYCGAALDPGEKCKCGKEDKYGGKAFDNQTDVSRDK